MRSCRCFLSWMVVVVTFGQGCLSWSEPFGWAPSGCPPFKEVILIFASSAVRELPIPPVAHTFRCERRYCSPAGIGLARRKITPPATFFAHFHNDLRQNGLRLQVTE